MGRTIRMEKSPNHTKPYAYFTFSLRISHSWRLGAGDTYLPTGIRTAAVPYESTPASLHIITYPCRMGQSLRINSPYLTYAFTMFTYQPYTVAPMNYTLFMAIRTLRSRSPCNPNTSRICRMTIRSIRIHYVSYKTHCVPSSTVRTKRTVREPEQSEKLPFVYKSRRISHSSPHFLITMKNGIHVDQRNRNNCSRHGASSMCSSSPWNWRRRKKERKRERRRSEKTSASKKKKKVKDWLKKRVQLGHNRTLLYELEEKDIASFKNYPRMDPDTFNEILERITPGIKIWVRLVE